MFTTGVLIIVCALMIRIIINLVERIKNLKSENAQLKYTLAINVPLDKDIIFDKEGGYKVIDVKTEAVSIQ